MAIVKRPKVFEYPIPWSMAFLLLHNRVRHLMIWSFTCLKPSEHGQNKWTQISKCEYRKCVWSFMVSYLISCMIWVYHLPFILWLPISLHTLFLKLIFHLQEVTCSYARFLCVRIRCSMHGPIITQDEDYNKFSNISNFIILLVICIGIIKFSQDPSLLCSFNYW